MKLWMFENWLEDQRDMVEITKNHAYLLGSFIDPKAVANMMGTSGNAVKTSDEEFERSTKIVEQDRDRALSEQPRRRRRRVRE